MARVRFTTTIDEILLRVAKDKAEKEGLDGVNSVIERALRVYFSNCGVEVWEKKQNDGCIDKLILRPQKTVFESVRERRILDHSSKCCSASVMESQGWKKVRMIG